MPVLHAAAVSRFDLRSLLQPRGVPVHLPLQACFASAGATYKPALQTLELDVNTGVLAGGGKYSGGMKARAQVRPPQGTACGLQLYCCTARQFLGMPGCHAIAQWKRACVEATLCDQRGLARIRTGSWMSCLLCLLGLLAVARRMRKQTVMDYMCCLMCLFNVRQATVQGLAMMKLADAENTPACQYAARSKALYEARHVHAYTGACACWNCSPAARYFSSCKCSCCLALACRQTGGRCRKGQDFLRQPRVRVRHARRLWHAASTAATGPEPGSACGLAWCLEWRV